MVPTSVHGSGASFFSVYISMCFLLKCDLQVANFCQEVRNCVVETVSTV